MSRRAPESWFEDKAIVEQNGFQGLDAPDAPSGDGDLLDEDAFTGARRGLDAASSPVLRTICLEARPWKRAFWEERAFPPVFLVPVDLKALRRLALI
ncbi:MAG: hypothetical protein ACKV22_23850 [Bryobacteraceae bacterium]